MGGETDSVSVQHCVSLLERYIISSYFSDEQWEYEVQGNDNCYYTEYLTHMWIHTTLHMKSCHVCGVE